MPTTYTYNVAPEEMMDGYCEHGTYVGGCGIDWMCEWCESGTNSSDYAAWMNGQTRQRTASAALATMFTLTPADVPTGYVGIFAGMARSLCESAR